MPSGILSRAHQSSTAKRRSIRTKSRTKSIRHAGLLQSRIPMNLSRHQALQVVLRQIQRNVCDQRAIELIELFQLEVEELTEHGLDYEQVKVLQRHCLHLQEIS